MSIDYVIELFTIDQCFIADNEKQTSNEAGIGHSKMQLSTGNGDEEFGSRQIPDDATNGRRFEWHLMELCLIHRHFRFIH